MKVLILIAACTLAGCTPSHKPSEADLVWEAKAHTEAVASYMKIGLSRSDAEARYAAFLDGSLYSDEDKARVAYQTKQREIIATRVNCQAKPWTTGC